MTTFLDVRRPATTAAALWVVTRLERPSGFAKVDRRGDDVRVAVGDDAARLGPYAGCAESLVTAVCDRYGDVVVETCSAPPGLLVGCDGIQLLPASPGLRRPTRMAPGDLLLLRSATALDAPPVGLVEILRAPASEVLAMSPQMLLETILGDETDGAAAVVARAHLAGP